MAYYDVLCVGHAAYDLIMTVDHHPGADEKCLASGMHSCGGGPAANAAVTAARLGGRAAFLGYLGEDFGGCAHFKELVEEGVETRWVTRGGYPTPISLILVKPDGARCIVTHKAQTPWLREAPANLDQCQPKVILFDGHEPIVSMPLAQAAKARGIPCVLDAGSVHEGTRALAPLVDYLITSERFALDSTGAPNAAAALDRLAGTAPFVAVTVGERGCYWTWLGEKGHQAAFAVVVKDTTGAGDTFHGAFALELARGARPLQALRIAGAAAALCCTKTGARPGIPRTEELEIFLQSTPQNGS